MQINDIASDIAKRFKDGVRVVFISGPSSSVTLYLPSFIVMVVPEELPANDDGVGLLPLTVTVKSDGFLLPPPSLITFLVTIILPVLIGGGGGGNTEYVLIIVHFLISPTFIVPEHSLDKVEL